jgi:hypothetical protein
VKFAVAVLVCSQLVYAADPLAESARQKLASIKAEKLPAGAVVPITIQEWNAWVRAEIEEEKDIGLREPKITLGQGTVTFEVIADFGKLAAKSNGAGMLSQMLAGERPVKLTARPDTANGKITVHLDSAEISGITLNGVLLKLVAQLVISRLFDDVEIDQPFDLPHKVDHATVEPSKSQFFIGPLQAQPPQSSRPQAR